MKKSLLSLLILFWPSLAMAQQAVAFSNLIPIGSFCQLSSIVSAVGLNTCSGGLPNATVAVITDETNNVRWRDDGVAPTADTGMVLVAGTTFVYQGDVTKIQFIAVSGSPVLDISFYKTR